MGRKQTIICVFITCLFSFVVGAIVMQLLVASDAVAAKDTTTITAQHFALIDANGTHRGGLGFDEGNPTLYLKDANGKNCAYLASTSKGPSFVLLDENDNSRLVIDFHQKFGPSIALMDGNGKQQLMLAIRNSTDPAIAMFDRQGKGRLFFGLGNEQPGLAFVDSRQQSQVLIQARDGQGALVSLHDGKNEPAVAMGLREGRSFVYAYDRDKSGFFAGAQSGKGPALALKERGKVAWAAGAGGDVKALEQGLDAAGFGMDLLR
ncbi:MAG: hypothetical protein V1797_16825 [Pseudomonadota bacterium]